MRPPCRRAAVGQLLPLLGPARPRAREHPRRPETAVVAGAADQRRVAVRRQRHAVAERWPLRRCSPRCSRSASALLGPARPRAREHPRRPETAAVDGAADQRRVAVGRQRHAGAELALPLSPVPRAAAAVHPVSFDPCWVQLDPRAREHPRCPETAVVVAGRRSAPCCRRRERHAVAELAGAALAGAFGPAAAARTIPTSFDPC